MTSRTGIQNFGNRFYIDGSIIIATSLSKVGPPASLLL